MPDWHIGVGGVVGVGGPVFGTRGLDGLAEWADLGPDTAAAAPAPDASRPPPGTAVRDPEAAKRPTLWTDTSPDAERVLIEGYRRMSLKEKAARLTALCVAGRQLALAGARARHPDVDDDAVIVRVAAQTLEPALLAAVLAARARRG